MSLQAARELPGREPQVAGQVSTRGETPNVSNEGHERGGNQETDTRNGQEELNRRKLLSKGLELPFHQLGPGLWTKAKPNPYAARLKDTAAVVLAPDVARVFQTSASVNTFLRTVIATVPRPGRKSTRPARRRKGGLTMR